MRFLCSQIVELRSSGRALMVNLEEIWEHGAILEAEEPATTGAAAQIQCGEVTLCGHIGMVEEHEFGWRIEMSFSPLTPWSPERFQPEHLLDVSELG